MMDVIPIIREARLQQGLTQAGLAERAGVSLPTIQNLEGGRANPSLSTLLAILQALGLRFRIAARPADWEALAACGAPLMVAEQVPSYTRGVLPDPVPYRATPDRLLENLRDACRELEREDTATPGLERKRVAVQSLLLALRGHFPTFFEKHLAGKDLYEGLLPETQDGRLVKGVREAASILARYL